MKCVADWETLLIYHSQCFINYTLLYLVNLTCLISQLITVLKILYMSAGPWMAKCHGIHKKISMFFFKPNSRTEINQTDPYRRIKALVRKLPLHIKKKNNRRIIWYVNSYNHVNE